MSFKYNNVGGGLDDPMVENSRNLTAERQRMNRTVNVEQGRKDDAFFNGGDGSSYDGSVKKGEDD